MGTTEEIKVIKTHKDLKVWQEAINLVLLVYEITEKYPQHEMFCLTSHTRKTAISVPSNINPVK